jgi:DNA-binding CsgD family transcriptional regulator
MEKDDQKRIGGRSRPGLTPREHEVLSLLCQGYRNNEIAEQMEISIKTVESHLRHIYPKLSVGHRAEAVAVAIRGGLDQPAATPRRRAG